MSEAPERIWVGNWLADVGETATWDMGEWRNEPWPTVDVVEYVRADRIEELEAKLDWVIVERDETFALMLDRAQTAEAKLAKAVEALEGVRAFVRDLAPYADPGHTLVPALEKACTALAELTGE